MTISVESMHVFHQGDGAQQTFDYNFRVIAPSHLFVYLMNDDDSTVQELVLDYDYSVTGTGEFTEGGTVVLNTIVPSVTQKLLIARILPLQQILDLRNQGSFFPENLEETYDRIVMMLQQLDWESGRSIKKDFWGLAWDALGLRIKNVGAPIRDDDAATLGIVKQFSAADRDYIDSKIYQEELERKIADQILANAIAAIPVIRDGDLSVLSDIEVKSANGLGARTLGQWLDLFDSVYNTVSEMVSDPGLIQGARVRTLGYHDPFDGGGNGYLIVPLGTGIADGGSIIDLNGVDLQAKALFVDGMIRPAQFGAKSDGSDAAPQIHACLKYYLDEGAFINFDGGNIRYLVGSQFTYDNFVAHREIRNLWIDAMDGFIGDCLMDFTGSGGTLRALRFLNNTFRGRSQDYGVSNVDYHIRLNNTAGVDFVDNDFAVVGICCIRDLTNRASTEVQYINNRLSGSSVDNPGAIAFWSSGSDSKWYQNRTREFDTHYLFDKAGQIVSNNHMYNSTASKAAWAIRSTAEGGVRIWNNYIDGLRLRFEKCPGGLYISDNHFIYNDVSEWTDVNAIWLEPENVGDSLSNVRIIGNGFVRRGGPNPNTVRISLDYDTANLSGVLVRDNTGSGVFLKTTEPELTLEFNSESQVTGSVGSQLITEDSSCLKGVTSIAITSGTGEYAALRAGIASSNITVQASQAITGSVRVTATCNV